MSPIDLETFFEGFGVRPETVAKIKEMGFTGQTFTSNLDELPSLLESIKQHCHLTLGEEWGIKGAAKKLQKGFHFIAWPRCLFWSFLFYLPAVQILPVSIAVEWMTFNEKSNKGSHFGCLHWHWFWRSIHCYCVLVLCFARSFACVHPTRCGEVAGAWKWHSKQLQGGAVHS